MFLQSIGSSCFFGGTALKCTIGHLVSAFGGPALLGLFMGALIFVAFYVASGGDLATPTVALILTGTVTVSMVPGQYQQLAVGVVVIGIAAALWQATQRYVLQGVQ